MHLVIGAAGYAGRHAVIALGERVTVRSAEPGDDLAVATAGVDVVHMAAELYSTFDRLQWSERPHPFLVQLVRIARETGVRRLVYLSTAHVFGFQAERITERTRIRSHHPYERLVARDEAWLREQGEPEVVVLRPAQGFGPGEPLVGCLLRRLLTGRLLLPGGGQAPRTFLAGSDLGRAFAAAALRGQPGVAYLVGGFHSCWRDLVLAAAVALGVRARVTWLSYDVAYLASTARELATSSGHECWPTPFLVDAMAQPHVVSDGWSRRELSWTPLVRAFEEGMPELPTWFRTGSASCEGRLADGERGAASEA